MSTVVLVMAGNGVPFVLDAEAGRRLARLGITRVSVAQQGVTVAVVLEGWAFDADSAGPAVAALAAEESRPQVLRPVLDASLSPSTRDDAIPAGERRTQVHKTRSDGHRPLVLGAAAGLATVAALVAALVIGGTVLPGGQQAQPITDTGYSDLSIRAKAVEAYADAGIRAQPAHETYPDLGMRAQAAHETYPDLGVRTQPTVLAYPDLGQRLAGEDRASQRYVDYGQRQQTPGR